MMYEVVKDPILFCWVVNSLQHFCLLTGIKLCTVLILIIVLSPAVFMFDCCGCLILLYLQMLDN